MDDFSSVKDFFFVFFSMLNQSTLHKWKLEGGSVALAVATGVSDSCDVQLRGGREVFFCGLVLVFAQAERFSVSRNLDFSNRGWLDDP